MEYLSENVTCKNCKTSGNGTYCSHCGHPYDIKRIELKEILHDVFHFFTHLDKGFAFTAKQLYLNPGTMQREFVEGNRSRYQKPFSMFFICASINAVCRYWILLALDHFSLSNDLAEANFSHQYMVLMHVVLVPVYALITWIFFYKSKYNYAEIGVLLLYTTCFFFLTSVLIFLLKFIWPHLDTAYIELPIFTIYNIITFFRFFREEQKWLVFIKSLFVLFGIFFLVQILENVLLNII